MVALAAVVNTQQPAETILPALSIDTGLNAQALLATQAEVLDEVSEGTPTAIAALAAASAQKAEASEAAADARLAVNAPLSPETEAAVKAYFADVPIMIEVARCESRYRHYDGAGGVIRGKVNNLDRGVMQINEYYHLEDSKKLGYDIHTLEGNLAYARYLYETQGTRPWISSSPCWAGSVDSDIAQK